MLCTVLALEMLCQAVPVLPGPLDQAQNPTTVMEMVVLILIVGFLIIKSLLSASRIKNSWLLEFLPFRRDDIKYL